MRNNGGNNSASSLNGVETITDPVHILRTDHNFVIQFKRIVILSNSFDQEIVWKSNENFDL